jgi:quercetin 2,3-dioxygenase
MIKTVRGVYQSPQAHWVGDGFSVRSLFNYEPREAGETLA